MLMRVKAEIDKRYKKTEVHICSNAMTSEVENLIEDVSKLVNGSISGTDQRGETAVLRLSEIIRFYALNQRVLAQDERGTYSIHQKLYELEESLDERQFLRISKSEIVNLKEIKRLDMNLKGTIKIILSGDIETYTSRRKISVLKRNLGIV